MVVLLCHHLSQRAALVSLSNFTRVYVDAFTNLINYFMQRPIALTPPITSVNVGAATSSSSSMRIVTRPSTAPQVPWQRERRVAQSSAVKEK